MKVSEFKFLGVNLYERHRYSEEKLEFNTESTPCEDIGLYIIGEYPRLKYNNVAISSKYEWKKILHETICLSILNLINTQKIHVTLFKDKKSYLFNILKFNFKGYCLKANVSFDEEKDLLSKDIINAIREAEVIYDRKTDIYFVIHLLINKYLGENGEYNKPAKQFLIRNLKNYSKTFNWISIHEQKKLLGIYKDYQVNLNEIYIPRIKMQHKNLKHQYSRLRNSDTIYWYFSESIKKQINKDLKRREPSDDSDFD
ncbi:hypothetical protein [Hyunsoonleella ulvae]|uniref:hypothetical protein n=1 Tax=Hyunsoonleella ulvae TaxID=2799948 RepID=UPI00193ABB96|nr:hypothetical protein [Hyunsoonleella ulvae]